MIDREHDLPITRQAVVLRISRGAVYYLPRPVSAADLEVMRRLDRLHLEFPFAGSRMLRGLLAAEGCKIGRRHVKSLMKRMGIEALYRRPRTTKDAAAASSISAVETQTFTSRKWANLAETAGGRVGQTPKYRDEAETIAAATLVCAVANGAKRT